MFLFQKDFLGLPDSKVTRVGSSALECSIELNWVPSAMTRSFAASLIFTTNLDYPPITDQLRKNRFSLKVTKVKEKRTISWYFVFDRKNTIWSNWSREQTNLHLMWPWAHPLTDGILLRGPKKPENVVTRISFASGHNF